MIFLKDHPPKDDPLALIPPVCAQQDCAGYRLQGTLEVAVRGRTRGYSVATATWFKGAGPTRLALDLSWSRWERLDVTVAVTGFEDGLPPVGPWQARIGIPIPQ